MRHLVSLVKLCTECDSSEAHPQFYIHLQRRHEYSTLLGVVGHTISARREYWYGVVVPEDRLSAYPCVVDAYGCSRMFDVPPRLDAVEHEVIDQGERYSRGFLEHGYAIEIFKTPAFVALVYGVASALSGRFGPRHIVILPPRHYYLLKAVDVKKLEEVVQ